MLAADILVTVIENAVERARICMCRGGRLFEILFQIYDHLKNQNLRIAVHFYFYSSIKLIMT